MQRKFYNSIVVSPDLRHPHPSHNPGAYCGLPQPRTITVYGTYPFAVQTLLSGQIIDYRKAQENPNWLGSLLGGRVMYPQKPTP